MGNTPGRSEFSADEERSMRGKGSIGDRPGANQRSESTQAARAQATINKTPPVTIAEDIIGGFSESKGQSNALRTAIRDKAFSDRKETGYDADIGARVKE